MIGENRPWKSLIAISENCLYSSELVILSHPKPAAHSPFPLHFLVCCCPVSHSAMGDNIESRSEVVSKYRQPAKHPTHQDAVFLLQHVHHAAAIQVDGE